MNHQHSSQGLSQTDELNPPLRNAQLSHASHRANFRGNMLQSETIIDDFEVSVGTAPIAKGKCLWPFGDWGGAGIWMQRCKVTIK